MIIVSYTIVLAYNLMQMYHTKTSHNDCIIASIMHAMLAKILCGTTINEERDESGIII
jgi:hypothetical protein